MQIKNLIKVQFEQNKQVENKLCLRNSNDFVVFTALASHYSEVICHCTMTFLLWKLFFPVVIPSQNFQKCSTFYHIYLHSSGIFTYNTKNWLKDTSTRKLLVTTKTSDRYNAFKLQCYCNHPSLIAP